jgi:hypothetical protein
MQTETRAIRVILAEVYGGKHSDPIHATTADRIYETVTGKKNPPRDIVAGWLEMGKAKEAEMLEVTEILHTFERELKRFDDIAGDSAWQDFARVFIRREIVKGHDYKTWLAWYRQKPERMEWAWKLTPKTIKAQWGQAFPEYSAASEYKTL